MCRVSCLADLPTDPPTPVVGASTDWLAAWDMDQYLYNVDHDPHRGVGIFAKATYSDGRVNCHPILHTMSASAAKA